MECSFWTRDSHPPRGWINFMSTWMNKGSMTPVSCFQFTCFAFSCKGTALLFSPSLTRSFLNLSPGFFMAFWEDVLREASIALGCFTLDHDEFLVLHRHSLLSKENHLFLWSLHFIRSKESSRWANASIDKGWFVNWQELPKQRSRHGKALSDFIFIEMNPGPQGDALTWF